MTMRFMMIYKPADTKDMEAGVPPTQDEMAKMGAFIGELAQSGVLLATDGLQPSSKGARVSFKGGKPKVTDGPFAEAKEVLGGYWMIQVKSREEAIEWASRCPGGDNEVIEIRQVQELSDFPADIQE